KYLEPIREEVRDALARFGWSKLATENMRRVDSFLRETQRFRGLGGISMARKVLKDFTFSDGTTVKKGQMLAVGLRATHYDSTIYHQADEFEGFRFVDSAETTGDELALPNRLVSTSLEFLPFGTGRHACPGRFWAANEMKAMLAYMVLNYDMRMEDDGKVPDEQWYGSEIVPDLSAHMLLKKREDTKF
ncbi:cytochrome P450, partial [Exidia glandulosa HHB12029]